MPFLNLVYKKAVQKYICKECNCSFKAEKQERNIKLKNALKYSAIKLILILRIKTGMSVRGTSDIIKCVYGKYDSIGFINNVCVQASYNATLKMKEINNCTQKNSNLMMFDETFPKTKENGCENLGVVVCENGLIRKVDTIDTQNRSNKLKEFFIDVVTEKYKPKMFMSDYDNFYPKAIKETIPDIITLKDFVHTTRQISRDKKSCLNKLEIKNTAGIKYSKRQSKDLLNLKKKLMKKRLNKIMRKMTKGFKSKYCSVGTIYIEGGLEELNEFTDKFSSIKPFYKKLKKFVEKHIETWNILMMLHAENGVPLTSNLIESKNSIFKAFSKKSKSYSSKHISNFFNCIALFENFDIKTRGINKGTNAMQRAEVSLNEFGAKDFFEAIGIDEIVNCDYTFSLTDLDKVCI